LRKRDPVRFHASFSLYGLELESKNGYFTFSELIDAPDFSIKGMAYLNTTALVNYAGTPWEVFEANGFAFNYDTGLVVPIASITKTVEIQASGDHYISAGLILPGSLTSTGQRVKSYMGWFIDDRLKFKYSEVTFV
jgi:hypothetical protein